MSSSGATGHLRPDWRGFELVPGLTAVPAEWERRLDVGWQAVEHLFRPTGELAGAYPCPRPVPCACAHDVVVHGPDDIVSV